MRTAQTTRDSVTLMNAFLCLAVVMIHLTADPVSMLSVGSFWHFAMFAVNKLLSFAVPGFLFLSGYKLSRKYGGGKMHVGKFFLGRAKKVVLPYFVAVFVYVLFFLLKGWATVRAFPEYFLLGTISAHFYYVILAVQAYLLFPLLRRIFSRFPRTVAVLSLLCTIVFQAFVSFPYSDRFIGAYIFYFVLGMRIAKTETQMKWRFVTAPAVIGAVALGVTHVILSYRALRGAPYRAAPLVHLLFITVTIIAVYGICRAMAGRCRILQSAARALSAVSYSVYLYHNFLLILLRLFVFSYGTLSVRMQFVIAFTVLYGAVALYAAAVALWRRYRAKKECVKI